jgi:transcriptional regulator with XRE-family HTH domain
MTTAGLARRLRSLRTTSWPSRRITQGQLAAAFDISPALISSWENAKNSAAPPTYRLEAYATFFATERSVAREPYRILPLDELTQDERKRRQALLDELLRFGASQQEQELPESRSPFEGTSLRFPVDEDITIVCSELPPERRSRMLYANPDEPDYVEAYKYADLDALLELFGHIRAANPFSQVQIRVAKEMAPDEYATHLILLGGVDWNPVTTEVMGQIDQPVRQLEREEDSSLGGFDVAGAAEPMLFEPVVQRSGARVVLREDVAQFVRAVSPFNAKRTVTVCNGMHQSGTLGVVRALTDARFRERNEDYLRSRFAGQSTFSVISRVQVVNGAVLTPDWTRPDDLLHEWPGRGDG